MKRTNGEILRDLRKKNNFTMGDLGKRIKKSTSFINEMEKNRRPIPDEILEEIIKILNPSKKDIQELRENIIEKSLPEILRKDFKNESFQNITNKEKSFKHKVYIFDTSKNGVIDITNYKEEFFMLEANIKTGSLIVKITGKELEPLFYTGDKLLFEFEKFENWTILNKKLVAFKYKEDYMIRKIKFYNKKPYFVALEDEVYDDIDILEHEIEIEYVGQLNRLLERDMSNIIFE
ncbi:MAG: helix-turn-helix domain-containing protein [Fusobacteriales bacterium]|jgi:transcriptional regulator with XRE-family HTH domain|nr:helix-turn-helix domain-containing protein [Fusobacteriales bacterium]